MRCALTIKGNVQNAGYRDIIENKAKGKRLRGYVFNDVDGTVKLVCEGTKERIDEFIDVINLHEDDIFVEDILKDEIPGIFPIPETFGRVKTDTKEDTNRKLDKGIKAIKSVKKDTVVLHEHTGLLRGIKEGQDKGFKSIKEGQDKLLKGQDKLIGGQDDMVKVLKEISNKL